MKNIIYTFLMLFGIYVMNACTDLDEDLRDSFTQAGGEEGEEETTAATADGAFSKLLDGDAGTANHNNFFSIQEVSTDEVAVPAKGGDWFDGGIWVDMHRHEWKSTSEPLNNTWRGQYEAIGEANRALANPNLTNEEIAQVRVLRAYLYYRLLDTFGNVKIVTVPEVDAPQSDREEVFDFVETELLEAINSGDLSQERGNVARINEYAARGVLAKLYLNAEVYTSNARWDDAAAQAQIIMDEGPYDLSPNYSDVFSPTNADNIEHIWVVPFDETTGENMNFAQMTLHYGSQETFNLQDQPWNGYTTLEEFYNSYEDSDERKANNFLVGPQVDSDGDPILDLAKESNDPEFQLVYTPEINELFPNAIRQGGARMFKFNFKDGQRPNMDNDYPILRLGDIYLIRAEAVARSAGDWNNNDARMWVNLLRDRAGVDPFGTLTEQDFFDERGREMFMEVTRRQDLIRFGRWGAAWWEKPAHDNSNLNLFPIPLDQINAAATTDNPLTQNDGY